jgi:hypothetical protein
MLTALAVLYGASGVLVLLGVAERLIVEEKRP